MCSQYYLPLFGLLVGVGTVLITLFAIKWMVTDQLDMDNLFKDQMDSMVEGFKEQIPMSSAFLTDTLTEKLKQFGLIEVRKITPKIKQQIQQKLFTDGLILVGIGALFGLFMGLLYWWICAK